MNPQKRTSTPALEKLIAVDPSTIQAPALKLALERQQKQQEELAAEQALRAFNSAQRNIQEAVGEVRRAREIEAKAVKKLGLLNAALEAFKQDGNITKYDAVVAEVRAL